MELSDPLNKPEVIMHAAVKSRDEVQIFFGKCHADCFYQAFNVGVQMSQKADSQGFFTSHGRFVTRSVASNIAVNTGYVCENNKYLFSEELWDRKYEGKFDYDYIKGYYKKD